MAAQIPSSFDFQHFTPVLAFQDISILSQVYLQDLIFFSHCVQRSLSILNGWDPRFLWVIVHELCIIFLWKKETIIFRFEPFWKWICWKCSYYECQSSSRIIIQNVNMYGWTQLVSYISMLKCQKTEIFQLIFFCRVTRYTSYLVK